MKKLSDSQRSHLARRFFQLHCLFMMTTLTALTGCGGGRIEAVSNSDPAQVNSKPDVVANKGDWPWWAGPSLDFSAEGNSVPNEFGPTRNLLWQTELKGEGHASPIVVDDQVYLASASVSEQTMKLICFARSDGKQRWETPLHSGSFMRTHSKNSHASSTPACDGERIFTAMMFGNGIQVSAVDREGKILWQTNAGAFQTRHGFGSSPVLYKSLVIVAGDNPGSGFVTALDRSSGKIVWRITRKNESSYASPVILSIKDQKQLVLSGAGRVHGYDPATGREIWSSNGPASTTANTVVSDGTLVFSGGGYPQHRVYAIDPENQSIEWEVSVKNYVPSPVLAEGQLIVPQDNGLLNGLDRKTGSENWKIRLGEDLSGSPVRVGNRVFIGGESGTVFVVDVTDGKIIARNRLDSRIMSTPAICGNQIFIRTSSVLYCFAEQKTVDD